MTCVHGSSILALTWTAFSKSFHHTCPVILSVLIFLQTHTNMLIRTEKWRVILEEQAWPCWRPTEGRALPPRWSGDSIPTLTLEPKNTHFLRNVSSSFFEIIVLQKKPIWQTHIRTFPLSKELYLVLGTTQIRPLSKSALISLSRRGNRHNGKQCARRTGEKAESAQRRVQTILTWGIGAFKLQRHCI